MATFFLVKPIDMTKASGLLWQDVPNRGGRITISADLRRNGDVGLSSGWQGDNSGETAHQPAPGNTNDYAVVPIAKNPDGSAITGPVMGRILNASGPNSSPIIEHSNPSRIGRSPWIRRRRIWSRMTTRPSTVSSLE